MLLDGLAKLPHRVEKTRPVPRFDVMESLIIDQLCNQSLIRFGHTAGDDLVQHIRHFCFDESPTVEQNLA